MASLPLHYVDLRTFAYETEDEGRVEDALRTFLPEEFEIARAESEGHYGDRIVVLSARVERADDVRHVLDRLSELANGEMVRAELEERVTENCEFYLRLSKQAALAGDVERGEGITLRAKVEAYPATREAALENMASVLDEWFPDAGTTAG